MFYLRALQLWVVIFLGSGYQDRLLCSESFLYLRSFRSSFRFLVLCFVDISFRQFFLVCWVRGFCLVFSKGGEIGLKELLQFRCFVILIYFGLIVILRKLIVGISRRGIFKCWCIKLEEFYFFFQNLLGLGRKGLCCFFCRLGLRGWEGVVQFSYWVFEREICKFFKV